MSWKIGRAGLYRRNVKGCDLSLTDWTFELVSMYRTLVTVNSSYSTFSRFGRPSFWEGLARALDLGGTLQIDNETLGQPEADSAAMYADWQATGDDLWAALTAYEARATRRQQN